MFSGCTVPPDSKETKLGSSGQEASPTGDKNTGVVLVPCLAHGNMFLQLFSVVWIFSMSLGVICYDSEFSVRITKITSRTGVS